MIRRDVYGDVILKHVGTITQMAFCAVHSSQMLPKRRLSQSCALVAINESCFKACELESHVNLSCMMWCYFLISAVQKRAIFEHYHVLSCMRMHNNYKQAFVQQQER